MQLVIRDLSKTYPNGTQALKSVSLDVPKGMFGSHVYAPGLDRAMLVVPNRERRALETDLKMLVQEMMEADVKKVSNYTKVGVEQIYSYINRFEER